MKLGCRFPRLPYCFVLLLFLDGPLHSHSDQSSINLHLEPEFMHSKQEQMAPSHLLSLNFLDSSNYSCDSLPFSVMSDQQTPILQVNAYGLSKISLQAMQHIPLPKRQCKISLPLELHTFCLDSSTSLYEAACYIGPGPLFCAITWI